MPRPVWFPTSVPDDWAPYRFGHWDSIPPWGWTWIDDQPWGFAPFHYGRWINVDGHWGWVPGAVAPHPVYAPALVAFIDAPDDSGGGPKGLGGGPDVGWFPLGPGDDYAPWYPAGPDYVESVNVAHWGHARGFGAGERGQEAWRGREAWRGQYFNRRFATVVSRGVFADGRRIDRGMMRVPADRFEHAAVMHGAPRGMMHAAAMRTLAAPGEFRGEPRGMFARQPVRAACDGSRAAARQENTRPKPAVAATSKQGPDTVPGRPQQQFGRAEAGRNAAAVERRGAAEYGRSEFGHNPAESYRRRPATIWPGRKRFRIRPGDTAAPSNSAARRRFKILGVFAAEPSNSAGRRPFKIRRDSAAPSNSAGLRLSRPRRRHIAAAG